MNRQQKSDVVQSLSEKFNAAEASFVVNCQGLAVQQMQELRLSLGAKNSELCVAKNRLVRIAIEQNPAVVILKDALVGQNAIVFAKSDLTAVAKILYDFAQANEELKLVAGTYSSRLLDKNAICSLAKLPSRDILLAQLFGTMKAPITGLAVVLQQIIEKQNTAEDAVANV